MVADDGMHLSAGRRGLRFELHQKVECLASLWSPRRNVANLNQVSLFSGPELLVIDDPSHFQDGHQCVLITMNITYRDHPRNTLPCILSFRGVCGPRREHTRGGQKAAAAHVHWSGIPVERRSRRGG